MTPRPIQRKPSRPRDVSQRKIDHTIYLRTYDVINSLDRAENKSWWDKALESIKRSSNVALPLKGKPSLVAPVHQMLALPSASGPEAEAAHLELITREKPVTAPILRVQQTAPRSRPVSWVLLAVVAVVTAGLTFAIIHFAWRSLPAAGPGERPKHVATYISPSSGFLARAAAS